MARAIYVILGFVLILSSCTERLICPAYQSAYIYDRDELRKKFSYFQEDTTPKILTASKNQYLIAEATPYRKKLRSLQTVPMKKVYVHVPDSISGKNKEDSVITADLDRAARSVMDTTMIVDVPAPDTTATEEDSTYVITRDKEVRILKYNMPDSLEYDEVNNRYVAQKPKYYIDEVGYNTEQDNYMWYLRRSLVLPDVRLAKMQQSAGDEKTTAKKEKQGFFGFFKNLFKKKDTTDIDSAELDLTAPEEEEFDYIDTTATMGPVIHDTPESRRNVQENQVEEADEDASANPTADKPSRKKKKKKKGSKDKVKEQPVKEEEEKKEEEEDDGF